MKVKIINKEDVTRWIDKIAEKYNVLGPVKIKSGDYEFKKIKSGNEISLDYINPVISPVKQFLFPSKEVMMKYEKKGKSVDAKVEQQVTEKTVLFGIRTCDLSAMLFLDKFFLDGFKDTFYELRRNSLITVNLVCTEPFESCFCVCADAGPDRKEGFDVQLTKINGSYVAEIGSEKGEEIVKIGGSLFKDASQEDIDKKEKIVKDTKENKFKMPTSYFSKAIRHVTANDIDEKTWDQLASRCVGCGSCSYVCPTCTCFNVLDIGTTNKGERVRTWDSCMYSGFTREVSGHNPRPVFKDRVKRRYYHKLSYYYMKKMGQHGCVGCGRCVIACIGGIDMPMVSKFIRRQGQ